MTHSKTADYSQNPMIVYWETTRACALACRHCRATAMPDPDPRQLTTKEAFRLLENVADFGAPTPHVILTGGDPLNRPDLNELIAHANSLGVKVSITPAATEALTREAIFALKDAGIDSFGLSLDGSTAEKHDAIRQVPGCFDRTIQAAKWAGEAGLPLQVNTLLARETQDDLYDIYKLLHTFPVMRWALFFLIGVGRGRQLHEFEPDQSESLMEWVYDLAKKAPFQVKTTEAPSYRRVAMNKMKSAGLSGAEIRQSSIHRGFTIRDGNGIVFVSHVGDVYPSGFLPVTGGNVRQQPLKDIYRSSQVFLDVRDVDNFDGKCGRCEYRKICGGSRARAYAHTHNLKGSDPICLYDPKVTQELWTVSTSA
ncbi:MAG TPA: TIGR04053 family radical SAM/SPASM domain-containing protein [Fimbriimonadaceae bacterium]|nr:TIGR04053 family radical SAM/SPASM domain-containing protein [Fimbriimonadaceae bacterium]